MFLFFYLLLTHHVMFHTLSFNMCSKYVLLFSKWSFPFTGSVFTSKAFIFLQPHMLLTFHMHCEHNIKRSICTHFIQSIIYIITYSKYCVCDFYDNFGQTLEQPFFVPSNVIHGCKFRGRSHIRRLEVELSRWAQQQSCAACHHAQLPLGMKTWANGGREWRER